ncbi:MAG TPA: amidohydrolase family protein [Syntrophorhabdaceae bacterium]|nr:amidohydrolase family protein [Syntrophorhabdaceae bacterium]HQM80997.1 amidohydrolase family protein [Syntrophorhabdaceae bacterium]
MFKIQKIGNLVIDLHTHGIGGYDTRGATPETILKIAAIHNRHGVFAILPTIYPSSIEEMRADMAAVRKAMAKERLAFGVRRNRQRAAIPGIHLEGPFLNPARCGALNKAAFLEPTERNFRRLIDGFEDIARIITVAPELKGAAKLIKAMADMGIIANMGHSDATYTEAEEGFKAGARGITHIFNAMRGFHHREPGIAGFGLLNKEVYIEVIADPFHLDKKTIELIFQIKDRKKIILVSDTVKGSKKALARKGARSRKGMLMGGSMTVAESARRLINMGFNEKTVMNCISRNPAVYLSAIAASYGL